MKHQNWIRVQILSIKWMIVSALNMCLASLEDWITNCDVFFLRVFFWCFFIMNFFKKINFIIWRISIIFFLRSHVIRCKRIFLNNDGVIIRFFIISITVFGAWWGQCMPDFFIFLLLMFFVPSFLMFKRIITIRWVIN